MMSILSQCLYVNKMTFTNYFCVYTDTLSTVGVDVGIWKYRKDIDPDYLKIKKKGPKPMRSVTFYTWDFGGQVCVGS